ncbi:hypothetical protein H0E87_018032 [Populus deltoides]|uniref:BHLH domain-containing protein n=1 Tax=Populus deltoides TaxID=3696 RepID=A0A8T2Y2N9_POPDE|nr:hypothetical protein H0E87_018032 [Populus deltoides]
MGLLLREVLKTLCCVNQWCYAVFWKIGYQNPRLLIWEECHSESTLCSVSPSTSRTENLVLPFREREGYLGYENCWRAAFTGNHEWILANNYCKDAHPPEVLNEAHHQFSAGMQTIAVVPVCPYGVLQLGSSLAIPENIGFVNIVKSSILQIGCIPGALLSDNHIKNESTERIGIPISCGMPLPVCFPGNYKVPNSTTYLADNFNQQIISSQAASRIVGRPSCSQPRQIQDNQLATSSAIHIHNVTKTLAKSCDDFCEPKIIPVMKPDNPFMGQLPNGVVGAEVVPSNPGAWLNQQTDSRPEFNHQPITSQSDANNNIIKLLERKIFSDGGAQNHVGHNKNESDSLTMSHVRTNGGLFLTSPEGSHISGQLPNEMGGQTRPHSIPCSLLKLQKLADINHSSTFLAGVGIQNAGSSRAEEVHLSSLLGRFSAGGILSGSSNHEYHPTDVKPTKNEIPAMEKKVDSDLFQALNIPLTQPGEHIYLGEKILGPVNDCPKNASGSQNIVTVDAMLDEPCAQLPSGDDLYDILGVGFKNKLLNDQWNNLLREEACVKTQDMVKDALAFTSIREANSDIFSLNEGISDSNMFSDMGTDLLDAVVSRVHAAAKQNSDDNVSCKTSLTKISTLSFPSGSPTYGSIGMADQNLRPRPKDRQMIQDRVKELREIVPNGAKCSIDSLLERTIKHMLFLQSVTKHADKLKQTGDSKLINKEGGLHLKDNFEGGATWAFEVGSRSMVCPIIVEDLNPPRQMLVEANRDITRMEIFMSLVQLLEQTVKGSAGPVGALENGDMMVHLAFPQTSSIPATGMPSGLQ